MTVFLIFRLGRSGDILHWGYDGSCLPTETEENQLVFGITTSTTYLYIVLVLMVGIALGDSGQFIVTASQQNINNPNVLQLLLFNLFGFLLYIALGAAQIAYYRSGERPTTVRQCLEIYSYPTL